VLHEEPLKDSVIQSIVRRYYVVSACYVFGPLFIFGVYPLFLRSRGLNQLQINVVVAAYVLMTFLTDVPTGAFADAVGRRAAVVVGCSLHAAAFLIYFLSHHYWYFIVAAAADGLGTTFGNGPIDAWAIDAGTRQDSRARRTRSFRASFNWEKSQACAVLWRAPISGRPISRRHS